MPDFFDLKTQVVKAVHGSQKLQPDSDFESEFAEYLRSKYDQDGLLNLYTRFAWGDSDYDLLMRRIIWRTIARRFGSGVHIGSGVNFKHLENFEIGDGVFIGVQTFIQGWFKGQCIIGNNVWIGPQSYFDARNLIIEDSVGWGPGAKALCSSHTGLPIENPIIQTDFEVKLVKVETGADVGMNAVILPGVTIGKGSIVGAGAVVTKDVAPYSVVAGVPAKFLRWREGYELLKNREHEK
jgi:acetyltransferase-like isoleucine patch superfamily enzyme